MYHLTPEAAVAATQIHHLVAEFAAELDHNDGRTIDQAYTADGVCWMGERPLRGHAEILAFYRERIVRLATEQKGGVRTSRHVFTNVRVKLEDADHARVDFISVQYAGEGAAPIQGVLNATSVADCHMQVRREADGVWRVAEFAGVPVFLGDDPFLKKSLCRG
jgi:hypothetical protein